MNHRPAIFLSASIPMPGREFFADTRRLEIREAVLAVVSVCHEFNYRLAFGGHPAISPLGHHAAETLEAQFLGRDDR